MSSRDLLRISQVAKLLGVSPSSLRNWERLGLIAPARTESGYRLYSRETVRQLKRVQFLRKTKHVNPAGILQMRGLDPELRENTGTSEQPLGLRLQHLRRQMKLSLSEVSVRTGLSASFISAVERDQAKPSVASLQRLTHVYRTNLLAFFESPSIAPRVVRAKERRVLHSDAGVRMELLAFGVLQLEALMFRVSARASSGGAYKHEGEEFIYVLEGKFEMWLDEVERYLLEPGDSLYFPSTLAHRWRCVGDRDAVLLWINTPASF